MADWLKERIWLFSLIYAPLALTNLTYQTKNHSYWKLPNIIISGGSRISPRRGRQLPKLLLFCNFFAKNCMKMKEFGPPGGARVPGAPLRSANDYLLVNCTYLFISSIIFIVNCHLMHVVCVESNGPHVSVTVVERDMNQQARILRFAVVVTRDLWVTGELCRVKTTFHATASLAVSGHANVRFQEDYPTNDNWKYRYKLPGG